MPSILICNSYLRDYTGSEIHCLEIASYFKSLEWSVMLSAPYLSEAYEQCINQMGVEYITPYELKKNSEFDIVWTHQRDVFLFFHYHKRVKAKKIIHMSLSPYESLEFYPFILEDNIHHHITKFANSQETGAHIKRTCGFDVDKVIHNFVTDEYLVNDPVKLSGDLNNILIVSNHLPFELRSSLLFLRRKGINVDVVGMSDQIKKVSRSLLEDYDLVVSIGKTVQYCLAIGLPVFLYDRFAGAGYLTNENFSLNEDYNFSGRPYERRQTAKSISEKIVGGYLESCKNVEKFRLYACNKYHIKNQLADIQTGIKTKVKMRQLPELKPFSDKADEIALSKEYAPPPPPPPPPPIKKQRGILRLLRKKR